MTVSPAARYAQRVLNFTKLALSQAVRNPNQRDDVEVDKAGLHHLFGSALSSRTPSWRPPRRCTDHQKCSDGRP